MASLLLLAGETWLDGWMASEAFASTRLCLSVQSQTRGRERQERKQGLVQFPNSLPKFHYAKRKFPVTSKCRQMHGILNIDEIKN
jgi:hypothetical protein